MTNRNKKIIKKAKEKAHKKSHFKKIREKVEMIVFNFGVFMCFICFPVTFLFISFNNDSVFLSFLFAIFSIITTFIFEILEWKDLKSKNIAMISIPVIFMFFLLILYIINKALPKVYALLNNIDSHIPNIITMGTFVVYFTLFFIRNHQTIKK